MALTRGGGKSRDRKSPYRKQSLPNVHFFTTDTKLDVSKPIDSNTGETVCKNNDSDTASISSYSLEDSGVHLADKLDDCSINIDHDLDHINITEASNEEKVALSEVIQNDGCPECKAKCALGVQCWECVHFFHKNCIGISEECYELMYRPENKFNLQWVCTKCKTIKTKSIIENNLLKEINDKLQFSNSEMLNKICELSATVESMKEEVKKNRSEILRVVQGEIKAVDCKFEEKIAEIFKEAKVVKNERFVDADNDSVTVYEQEFTKSDREVGIRGTIPQHDTQLKECIANTVCEQLDHRKRQKNLVLYNVMESSRNCVKE